MSHSLALNEPAINLQLIDNLNQAIDEARLVRSIMNMKGKAAHIESTIGSSARTRQLRDEAKNLESQLAELRNLNCS